MKALRPLLLLIGVLLLWQSCSPKPPTIQELEQANYARTDSLTSALITAGIDSQKIGELVDYLRPLLFSPLANRDLENWYVNKAAWIDKFSDPQNVFYSAEIIFEEYLQQDSLSKASRAKNAIGRLYAKDGNFTAAMEAGQEAYALAQRVADSTAIGWSLTSMSNSFFAMRDLEAARSYGGRALNLGRATQNAAIEATALIILGGIEARDSSYTTSLMMMQQGLAIARANELPVIERRALLNISYNYNHLKRYDEAIALLRKSIDFSKLSASVPDIILCFNLQGAYARKQEYEKAEKYLNLACQLANEMNFVYGQLNCEQARTKLYEQQGLYEKALRSASQTRIIEQKIMGLEQTRTIQSLKTQMRLLEKDLEIEKLDQVNKERELAYRQRFRRFIATIAFLAILLPSVYLVMRHRHQVKSAEQSKQLAETKLHMLQSQMHPHFVFNALGGVQNYVLKEEKIAAYTYLGKFATLLRTITRSSTQIHIELDQEVEFIKSYLDMEKLRFRDDFDYTLTVAPALQLEKAMIPSMFIQPIVENALVHGLGGLDRPGRLDIEIKPCSVQVGICCIVTDNGRGRVAARKIAEGQDAKGHLSIATINTSKRLDFLRRLGYEKVAIDIEDLQENGKPSGTRVFLFLPYLDGRDLIYASEEFPNTTPTFKN